MGDPKRLYDQRDALIAGLYAKRDLNSEDVFPVLTDTAGNLLISGTLATTPATTASTISNSVSNPANVSLVSTLVTVSVTGTVTTSGSASSTAATITNAAGNPANVALTNTAVTVVNTVTVTGTVTTSAAGTASTINNAVGNPVNVSLTSTKVTIDNSVTSAIAATLGNGSKNVTTTGSSVQLTATSTTIRWVEVIAKEANTDTVWVGGSTVAAGSGLPIVSLQSAFLEVSNLTSVWIDSEVNGEGVTFIYGI